MVECDDKKNLILLYPKLTNLHLMKDQGMIPYILYKYCNYNAKIACYNNGEYPYLYNNVRGIKLDFLNKVSGDRLNDGNIYLKNNYSQIDILYLHGIYMETLHWIETYKKYNADGKVYLKLDANIGWMNKLEFNQEIMNLLKKCDVISVECKKLYRYLNKKLPLIIEYIPNGFYNFYDNKKINYKEKENIILTVGRIGTKQKANEVLLEAFKLASSQISDWKLKLVGEIKEGFQNYLKNFLAENTHLQDKIIVTGKIDDRLVLEKEYQKAKIFCLTSRGEGFPIVFPEAAKNGCFIISTDLDPAWDITDNEKYGKLFGVNNVEQLSRILLRICNDQNRLKMVCNGIQDYVNRKFDWVKICKKLDILLSL